MGSLLASATEGKLRKRKRTVKPEASWARNLELICANNLLSSGSTTFRISAIRCTIKYSMEERRLKWIAGILAGVIIFLLVTPIPIYTTVKAACVCVETDCCHSKRVWVWRRPLLLEAVMLANQWMNPVDRSRSTPREMNQMLGPSTDVESPEELPEQEVTPLPTRAPEEMKEEEFDGYM